MNTFFVFGTVGHIVGMVRDREDVPCFLFTLYERGDTENDDLKKHSVYVYGEIGEMCNRMWQQKEENYKIMACVSGDLHLTKNTSKAGLTYISTYIRTKKIEFNFVEKAKKITE